MTHTRFGLFAILLFACVGLSRAAELSSAIELVRKMKVDEVITSTMNECRQGVLRIDIEEEYARDPNIFGGISPDSPLWPKAQDAYLAYLQSSCGYVKPDAALRSVEEVYANALAPSDIAEIIKFYDSDVGKRFLAASLEANKKWGQLQNLDHSSEIQESLDEYRDKLQRLLSKGSKKLPD